MTESNNLRLILLRLSKIKGLTMFRNNTGTAWAGKIVNNFTKNGKRYVTIEEPRPLIAGLTTGSSDLIGWKTIEITPNMVGKKISVFTALEVKTSKGRATKEQLNFLQQVKNNGGISAIVTNEDDAEHVFSDGSMDFIF